MRMDDNEALLRVLDPDEPRRWAQAHPELAGRVDIEARRRDIQAEIDRIHRERELEAKRKRA